MWWLMTAMGLSPFLHILESPLLAVEYLSGKGVITRVSDDVIIEVLRGWESWPGSSADYYREIGLSKQQLAVLLKKGKQLIKSGKVTESEFKELSFPMVSHDVSMSAAMEGLM